MSENKKYRSDVFSSVYNTLDFLYYLDINLGGQAPARLFLF